MHIASYGRGEEGLVPRNMRYLTGGLRIGRPINIARRPSPIVVLGCRPSRRRRAAGMRCWVAGMRYRFGVTLAVREQELSIDYRGLPGVAGTVVVRVDKPSRVCTVPVTNAAIDRTMFMS
jgi:hypothetical protein